jgi:hypothetical protein
MTGDDESLLVEQVIERLIARYPSVSPEDIELLVRGIHQRFDGGRIRDFVPLLVEKAARRILTDPAAVVSVVSVTAPPEKEIDSGRGPVPVTFCPSRGMDAVATVEAPEDVPAGPILPTPVP